MHIKEETLSYEKYLQSPYAIVIDNDFLKLMCHYQLSPKIKVFSRISPENKALIVRNIRKSIHQKRKQMRWLERIFSDEE